LTTQLNLWRLLARSMAVHASSPGIAGPGLTVIGAAIMMLVDFALALM
jgi:hypothetical protein